MGKKEPMVPNPENRKERRLGMHGKPSEWASANSILKGRYLDSDKVEAAKKASHG